MCVGRLFAWNDTGHELVSKTFQLELPIPGPDRLLRVRVHVQTYVLVVRLVVCIAPTKENEEDLTGDQPTWVMLARRRQTPFLRSAPTEIALRCQRLVFLEVHSNTEMPMHDHVLCSQLLSNCVRVCLVFGTSFE